MNTTYNKTNVRQLSYLHIKDRYDVLQTLEAHDMIILLNNILSMSVDSVPIIHTLNGIVIKGQELIYLVQNMHSLYVNVATCEIKAIQESDEDITLDTQIISNYINDYIQTKMKEYDSLYNYDEKKRELDKDASKNREAINKLSQEKDRYSKSYVKKLCEFKYVLDNLSIIIIELTN